MEFIVAAMPTIILVGKEILKILNQIALPLIPVLLFAIIVYFIKIDSFTKIRDEIMVAKKRAMRLKDLRKIRQIAEMYERKIDRYYQAEKITELDKQYLDTLLAQIKYLNIVYH